MIRHNTCKAWCFCLLVVVLLTCLCSGAEFAGGAGAPDDPYQIATAAQLVSIGSDPNLLDQHFILVADIDLDPNLPGGRTFEQAVIAPNSGMGFESPFDYQRATPFTGAFDGNNRTIDHLTIRSGHFPESRHVGLFGRIGVHGVVRRLALANVSIRGATSGPGSERVGALAGHNIGTVEGCHVTCTLDGGSDGLWIGGVVGYNEGRISDCDVTGYVSRSQTAGGLVGYNTGMIIRCSAAVGVRGETRGSELGGLVGRNEGRIAFGRASGNVSGPEDSMCLGGLVGAHEEGGITHSCAQGDVSAGEGSHTLGGLVGWNLFAGITGCYATGQVSAGAGSQMLGGLVGDNLAANVTNCWASGPVLTTGGSRDVGGLVGVNAGSIANCYALGHVSAEPDSQDIGALAGRSLFPVINCFWNTENSGQSTSAGGAGLTTTQMQDPRTYLEAGWDLAGEHVNGTSELWQMPRAGGYPELTVFSGRYVPPILKGVGTLADPYQVATAEDLGAVCHHDPSACYELAADLNLAGTVWTTAPVGDFAGSFHGAGRKITQLTIRGGGFVGLFACLGDSALVDDLGIEDVDIVSASCAGCIGALAGFNRGDIRNCRASGSITGGDYCGTTGGLVGRDHEGQMSNCSVDVHVSVGKRGAAVGGLLGATWRGAIRQCSATGAVACGDEGSSLGGFLGSSSGGRIEQCYATGSVSCGRATRSIGGLVGHNRGDNTTLTLVPGAISESYATGRVPTEQTSEFVGGLVGQNGSGDYAGQVLPGTITACYATGAAGSAIERTGGLIGWNMSGDVHNAYFLSMSNSAGTGNTRGKPLTDGQMKQRASFVGWNFADSWGICEGQGYPFLRWQNVRCEP